MRLPNSEHTSRPWRIHELTRDFRLEDVWALPTPGGPDDLPRLVQQIAAGDTSTSSSRAARALFAIRWKLGALLGWDDPDAGHACSGRRCATGCRRICARPPARTSRRCPSPRSTCCDDEWAAEIVNRTVHAVLHIGWVPDGHGGHRGQMAVLVKPNGRLGTAYMAAITPFRHLRRVPAADAGHRAGVAGARRSSRRAPPRTGQRTSNSRTMTAMMSAMSAMVRVFM